MKIRGKTPGNIYTYDDAPDVLRNKLYSELLRLIEVGASCFNHHCVGYDVTQLNVLHNVHRRISSGYSIPTVYFVLLCCFSQHS